MAEKALTFGELCPQVREVGLQRTDFWHLPRRIYDHEFLYCVSGQAQMTIGREQHVLTPGHLAIVPPDTPHTLHYPAGQEAVLLWLHCDFTRSPDGDWVYSWYNTPENYVLCFADHLPHPEHIRPEPVFPGAFRLPRFLAFDDGAEVEALFRSLLKAYAGEGNHFALLSQVTVLRLLDAVCSQCGYWRASAQPIRVSDAMKQYIRDNYMNKITLRDIGQCTKYHPDYAGKLFRRETGQTVIDYINHFRIRKAQTLLLDTSLSAAEIAEKCGFQSVNYFSSVSRQVTGMSPRQLRTHLLTIMDDAAAGQERNE